MSVSSRLSEVFESSKQIDFDDSSKMILFSDCHRGDNSWTDDFAHNQNVFFSALDYYYDQGFTYIEIGDGDEIWENRNFDDIRKAHSHIFWKMSQFHEAHRLYLVWGNHNRKWRKIKNVQRHLYRYYDEREGCTKPLFDGITVHEGLTLRHSSTNKKIFLTHGHQGDLLNDKCWWVGRFIVRNIWKFLQLFGAKDPTSPAKNFEKRQILEKKYVDWISNNKEKANLLIVGHTHRPYLPEVGKPPYFNTGSCVHPRCITGVEIENEEIRVIKWFVDVKPGINRTLFVNKVILAGPRKLQDF